jgi:hypothetical protein
MNSLLSHVTDLPKIPGSELSPRSFKELLEELGCNIDSTGFKLVKDDTLPKTQDSITPRIFQVNRPYKLEIFRLSWSGEGGGFVMDRGQAAAYLRSEITSPQCVGPCTVWIPFTDGEGSDSFVRFIIRIYRRANNSTEVFFYGADDESDWDHKGDYFVALGKYSH